jgi:aminoglycoside phosphotransferase (APT) family kinase protein
VPQPAPHVPPGVDLDRLTPWLAEHIPAGQIPAEHIPAGQIPAEHIPAGRVPAGVGDGPPEVRLIAGGRSNLTYLIVHNGQSMVLRRPPLGHVLATAHDMRREYTVLTALYPTEVPVPRTLAYCDDPDVIGAPFYVMDHVDGTVYRTARDLVDADGKVLGEALADTLAHLHLVEPESVGLADFGRPEGFLDRQLRRWRKQLAASYTRPLPGADELAERLAGTIPAQRTGAIVHGDFRLDNVIVRDDRPSAAAAAADLWRGEHGPGHRIVAVLDWEMSTLGDPLTDLGITCVYWDGLGQVSDAFPPSPGSLPGWPGRADLVDRYARATGTDVDRLDWYVAFAYFKLAVILEGIWCRYTQGLTVGEGFDQIGAGVPELISRGLTASA